MEGVTSGFDFESLKEAVKESPLLDGQMFNRKPTIKGLAFTEDYKDGIDIEFTVPHVTNEIALDVLDVLQPPAAKLLSSVIKASSLVNKGGDGSIVSDDFIMQAASAVTEILMVARIARFLDKSIVRRTVKVKIGDQSPFIIGDTGLFDLPAYRRFQSAVHAKILVDVGLVFMGGR